MKKTLLLIVTMFWIPLLVPAQIQQGYVKTKGRLASDGTVIAGTRLPGATVTVKGGNAVVSGNKGTFTLAIPSNNYYLQNVQKQGYVLTDPDILAKQYVQSKNPLMLVMETPEEQSEDKLEAIMKIRTTLQTQLMQSRAEIKSLKEQNKITQEEYRKKLQELASIQESNEKLVNDMAERYSKIDYDQLDDFNARISDCILNGRLQEADSLLKTKGDIKSRTTDLRNLQEQNAKEEAELTKRKRKLEKRIELAQRTLEDIAEDCYSKFEIFKIQHQNDSAAYYIEYRASLDSTNVAWTVQSARFISNYLANYAKAIKYYEKSLDYLLSHDGKDSKEVASLYCDLSSVYIVQDKYKQAIEMNQKSLDIYIHIYGEDHLDVGIAYSFMGMIYQRMGEYNKALEYLQKAALIEEKTDSKGHLPSVYMGLSIEYGAIGDYDNALEYIEKARKLIEMEDGQNSLALAECDILKAVYYTDLGEFANSRELQTHALGVYKEYYGELHPNVAKVYNSIANNYALSGNYTEAVDMAHKALNIQLECFGEDHSEVGLSYQSLGYIYSYQGDNQKALDYSKKALMIFEKKESFFHLLAQCYNNVGYLQYLLGQNEAALENHQKALDLRIKIFNEKHRDVAQSYDNIGMAYFKLGKYNQSLESHKKALSIRKETQGENHPELAWSYLGIGDVFNVQGNLIDALENYQKAYLVRAAALGEEHPETKICIQKINETQMEMERVHK